jgi:hypothetical protein
VAGSPDAGIHLAAVDLLTAPLDSSAGIGNIEVRRMAVAAMEKIGLDAPDVGAKARACEAVT